MAAGLHKALFGLVPHHERLVAQARGQVLELGGGLNVPHYRGVDRVMVMAPDSAHQRDLLERVAAAVVEVEVHEASLAESAIEPDSFDTVVCTFVLCTAPDPHATLGRLHRLLRPGGRLLFLEHVQSGGLRGTMQAVASHAWQRMFGGCHPDRDSVVNIQSAGFVVTDLTRFSIRLAAPVVRPAVHGIARKAAA